jgi:hypothetical protein
MLIHHLGKYIIVYEGAPLGKFSMSQDILEASYCFVGSCPGLKFSRIFCVNCWCSIGGFREVYETCKLQASIFPFRTSLRGLVFVKLCSRIAEWSSCWSGIYGRISNTVVGD